MFNPISAHRQEVSDRILKGFDADTIEKAPQLRTKMRRERISKEGHPWFDYRSHKNRILIHGKDVILNNGQRITTNSKMLLKYTKQMKDEVKENLTSMGCTILGESGDWKNTDTGSSYLRFKYGKLRFEMRISDHTKPTENYGLVEKLRLFRHNNRDTWYIDANLGRIKPQFIKTTVKWISRLWNKYNSNESLVKLKDYVEKQNVDFISESHIYDDACQLAEKYINENNVADGKLQIAYRVLTAIFYRILYDMYDEDK